ncbi:hypothetical protein T492DRAFT_1047600, partial [Pavlovales sp. CCMP2436]
AAHGLYWRQRRAGCTVSAALALAFILSAGGRAMDVDELYFPVVGDWGAPRERPEMKSSHRPVARAWTPFFE